MITKYYYKEGEYTRASGVRLSWDKNSWTLTGENIEVTKNFYFNFLIPEEARIKEKLKELGINRDWHHCPFYLETEDDNKL